jgi:hypothetical protein
MRGMRPRELDFITATGPEEEFNGTLNMQTVESIVGCTRCQGMRAVNRSSAVGT